MNELPSSDVFPSKYQIRRVGFGDGHPCYLKHRLTIGTTLIGRLKQTQAIANKNIIPLSSLHTSRKHCTIEVTEDGAIFLTDISSHGTFIGSDKVHRSSRELRVGDMLSLGVEHDVSQFLHPDYIVLKIELFEPPVELKAEMKNEMVTMDINDIEEDSDLNLVIDEMEDDVPVANVIETPRSPSPPPPPPAQISPVIPMVQISPGSLTKPSPGARIKQEFISIHMHGVDGERIEIVDDAAIIQDIIKPEVLEEFSNTQQLLSVLDSQSSNHNDDVEIIELIDTDDEEDPLDKQLQEKVVAKEEEHVPIVVEEPLPGSSTEMDKQTSSVSIIDQIKNSAEKLSESDKSELLKVLEQIKATIQPTTSKVERTKESASKKQYARKKTSPKKKATSKKKESKKGHSSSKKSKSRTKRISSSEGEITKVQNPKALLPVVLLERCNIPSSESASSDTELVASSPEPSFPQSPPSPMSPEHDIPYVPSRMALNQLPRVKPKLPPPKPKATRDLLKDLIGKKTIPEDAPKIKQSMPKKIPCSRRKTVDERFPVVPEAPVSAEVKKATPETTAKEIPEIKAVVPAYKNVIIQPVGPRKRQAHCGPRENPDSKKKPKIIHNIMDIKTPAQLKNEVYRIPKKRERAVEVPITPVLPAPEAPKNSREQIKFYGSDDNRNAVAKRPITIRPPQRQHAQQPLFRRESQDDRSTPPPPSKTPNIRGTVEDIKNFLEKSDAETVDSVLALLNTVKVKENVNSPSQPLQPMEWKPSTIPFNPPPAIPTTSTEADTSNGLFTRRQDFSADQRYSNNPRVAAIKPSLFKAPAPKGTRKEFRKTHTSLPHVEYHEIIEHLLNWNTDWMQSNTSESPIHGGRSLLPLKLQYESFQEYFSLMSDLLELELFESVKTSYRIALNPASPQPSYEMYSISCIIDENNKTATLQAIVRGYDYARIPEEKLPRPGTLYVLYFLDDYKDEHQFLGYANSSDDLRFNKNHPQDVTVTFYCPNHPCIVLASPKIPIRFTYIVNVHSEILFYKSMVALEFSPLLKEILDPHNINVVHNYNFGSYVGSVQETNEQQKRIILEISSTIADGSNNIFRIKGPPGTGKTNLLKNLILQLQKGSEHEFANRILVCAPSNAAIDALTLRLGTQNERQPPSERLEIIRYGKTPRMDANVRKWSIDEQVEAKVRRAIRNVADQFSSESSFSKMRDELNDLKKKLTVRYQCEEQPDEKQRIKNNLIQVDEDIRAKENEMYTIKTASMGQSISNLRKKYRSEILKDCHVVCTTLGSSPLLENQAHSFNSTFDILIVDEATITTEYQLLAPLRFGVKNVLLIGDTKQLPALVKSPLARSLGLEKSLFKRIEDALDDGQERAFILEEQFRMHPDILAFPNRAFYKNQLTTANSVIMACKSFPLKNYLIFELDSEQNFTQSHNVYNTDEITFVIRLLRAIEDKVNTKDLTCAVISPYNRHGNEIQKEISADPKLKHYEVCTIDSMQGQEKDIVVFSCARTVGSGFLALENRLNVALTRAKKCLFICGNFMSLENSTAWNELLRDARRRDVLIQASGLSDSALRDTIQKNTYSFSNKVDLLF